MATLPYKPPKWKSRIGGYKVGDVVYLRAGNELETPLADAHDKHNYQLTKSANAGTITHIENPIYSEWPIIFKPLSGESPFPVARKDIQRMRVSDNDRAKMSSFKADFMKL